MTCVLHGLVRSSSEFQRRYGRDESPSKPALRESPPRAEQPASAGGAGPAARSPERLNTGKSQASSSIHAAGCSFFKRGLMRSDVTRSHETSAGVCVLKAASYPSIREVSTESLFRAAQYEKALEKVLQEDEERRNAYDRPRTRGSSQGSSAELLPRHMRLVAGKPNIIRRMPKDSEARMKRWNAEDSAFPSEHRAQFFWRENPEWQLKAIKMNVRPLDDWNLFRDTARKQRLGLRAPINHY
mmetsp:Transcript_10720/g.24352  ORF Transcript_10720/g.24352 Transcript_10720/m.24352 type:complete len:242 (+) Transcript_10720:48-773(+)